MSLKKKHKIVTKMSVTKVLNFRGFFKYLFNVI